MSSKEDSENKFWLSELTLEGLRTFVESSKDAPGDTPVVVHVISEFADEARWRKSKEKLEVSAETPVRAAAIEFESFSETHNVVENRYIESTDSDERTSLCVIYLNVIAARHGLRGDVDEFGKPK